MENNKPLDMAVYDRLYEKWFKPTGEYRAPIQGEYWWHSYLMDDVDDGEVFEATTKTNLMRDPEYIMMEVDNPNES